MSKTGATKAAAKKQRQAETFEAANGTAVTKLDFGTLNPKQAEFFKAETRYTFYGGAKGGGKSHVVDRLASYGALKYPGIKILMLRRQFVDLRTNHIEPLCKLLPVNVATYNANEHIMRFCNGSTILFGNYNYDSAWDSFNGQEFDWIFMDEATQFTYSQFRLLGGCLRGVNTIPKHFYLTGNPGGVGHRWVKRLFIDRDFITESDDPEEIENPDDYSFIFASVEDNVAMRETDPKGYQAYLSTLRQMGEKVYKAYRYGNWDDLGGSYFGEFSTQKHTIEPFPIPKAWRRYRAFDYGLDMFDCLWVAVDENGRSYVYREFYSPDLIVRDAAAKAVDHTMPNEKIDITFAPPDMWSRQRDTGKTSAELFMTNGVPVVKVSNNRVQGFMQMHEMLAPMKDGKPGLLIFNNCKHLIDDIASIQADEKDPNDCAKEPHEVSHSVDALRYYCISRIMPTFQTLVENPDYDELEGTKEEYEEFMCGDGEPSADYINA